MNLNKNKLIFLITIILIINKSLSYSQSSIYSDQDCLFCHGKSDISQITSDGKVRSVFVDPKEWNQDVHHKGKILCVDCHINANPYLHFREGLIDVDCARCHPEEAEEYEKNIHSTFTPSTITPGKELPLCHHCHTRHQILRHDDPFSSIHEKNVGETCGQCHAEVMVKGLLNGASLGKISGHRKGDLAEKFDMEVCINCHYDDAAHGAKRVYKVFCSRCHDVRSKANFVIGPTHLNSQRWTGLNYLAGWLTLILLIGICVFSGYKSRKKLINKIKAWNNTMKIEKKESLKTEQTDQEKSNKE